MEIDDYCDLFHSGLQKSFYAFHYETVSAIFGPVVNKIEWIHNNDKYEKICYIFLQYFTSYGAMTSPILLLLL